MDSYTTDAVSLGEEDKRAQFCNHQCRCESDRCPQFMLDFSYAYDIQISYFSENYNKHLVECSVFSITNGHRICAHTAE